MRKIMFMLILMAFGSYYLKAQEQQQVYYTNLDVLKRPVSSSAAQYTYDVYELPNHTYGYIIFADGEKYLHQPNMPGKGIDMGFSSKGDAQKVAEIIVKKLRYPVVPAQVNTIEMLYWGLK